MKNKYFRFFILSLIVSAAVVACNTTPDTDELTPPPPAVITTEPAGEPAPGQNDLNSLNAAVERAAAARQLAEDFYAPGYFHSEWESADALYAQAESSKSSATQAQVRESTARYNAAADALEALAHKTIVQFADDHEVELLNARGRAVKAGAEELAGDYLLEADNRTAEILPLYEAKDYYAARDALFLARDMYESLETGLNAYHLRLDLDDRGFVRYDFGAIDAADTMGLSAIEDYEAGNISDARSKAEDTLEAYYEYRAKWIETYAADAADSAAGERQYALDVKANIAVRFDFDTADVLYTRAKDSLDDERFEEAANLFDRSRSMFASASRLTLQKRTLAEEALREADSRMAESDAAAHRAEAILEGGI